MVGDWASRQQVYVLGEVGAAGAVRRVKIGVSVDPVGRLRDLQTGASRPLELLAHGPGGSTLEARLHRVFADHRVQGEWFDLDPVSLSSLTHLVSDPHKHLITATNATTSAKVGAALGKIPLPRTLMGWLLVAVAVIVAFQFALAVAAVAALLVVRGPLVADRPWARVGLFAAAIALVSAQIALGPLIDSDDDTGPVGVTPADAADTEDPPPRRRPTTTRDPSDPCGPGGWSANC